MEESENSENEQLRKQIQYLTDVIQNARVKRNPKIKAPYGIACDIGSTTKNKSWKSRGHVSQIAPGGYSNHGIYSGETDDLSRFQFQTSASQLTNKGKNSSGCLKHTIGIKNTKIKSNEISQLKPGSSKSHFSGNSGSKTSDSEELQKEIKQMNSKIAELEKLISTGKAAFGTYDKTNLDRNKGSALSRESNVGGYLPVKKIPTMPKSLISQGKSTVAKSEALKTKSGKSSEFSITQDSSAGKVARLVSTTSKDQPFDSLQNCAAESFNQATSDLIPISKYKLTRIGSSPTKQPCVKSLLGSEDRLSSKALSTCIGRQAVDGQSVHSAISNQKLHVSPNPPTNNVLSAPRNFVKKSKYSITKIKSSTLKDATGKKPARRLSNTPAKFVKLSKYAIKRVRRSLSDETKQKAYSTASTSNRNHTSALTSSQTAQNSVAVVKSKFKMEKIPLTKVIAKSCKNSSHNVPYYKYDKAGFYNRRGHYKQRYKFDQYKDTRYGFYSNFKTGHYNRGFTQGNLRPTSYMGRSAWQSVYNRRAPLNQRYVQRKIQLMKEKTPFNPKHKLDRRIVGSPTRKSVNFVMINGMLYRSSAKVLEKASRPTVSPSKDVPQKATIKKSATSNMKTVTVRGVKFEVDSNGRSLKRVTKTTAEGQKMGKTSQTGQVSRIDIGGIVYMQTKPGTLERVASAKSRMAATRVVNKTVHQAAAKYKKDNTKILKKKKYCMFYNRFGKCNKKADCPYIHDPEKVAVCTRFLRGTCKVKDCPFSHKVSKDKMPVCSYFMKGVCNKDECPYLHVNVNRDAAVCDDFLKGYCPRGEKCTKKHILSCPEFSKTGLCSKGNSCKLQHRKSKKRKIQTPQPLDDRKKLKITTKASIEASASLSSAGSSVKDSNQGNLEVTEEQRLPEADSDDKNTKISLKRKLPAYISLKTSVSDSKSDVIVIEEEQEVQTVKPSMRIRPQLGYPK